MAVVRSSVFTLPGRGSLRPIMAWCCSRSTLTLAPALPALPAGFRDQMDTAWPLAAPLPGVIHLARAPFSPGLLSALSAWLPPLHLSADFSVPDFHFRPRPWIRPLPECTR